jgi:chromosome segregation ATPase
VAWFSFGRRCDLESELHAIHNELRLIRRNSVATNEELQEIAAKLDEATAELSGLPAEIAALVAQVESGQTVDPELLASVKAKAQTLADIVPNKPEPEPEPEPAEPEPTPE